MTATPSHRWWTRPVALAAAASAILAACAPAVGASTHHERETIGRSVRGRPLVVHVVGPRTAPHRVLGIWTGWQNATFRRATAFVVELPGGLLGHAALERHAAAVLDVARRVVSRASAAA